MSQNDIPFEYLMPEDEDNLYPVALADTIIGMLEIYNWEDIEEQKKKEITELLELLASDPFVFPSDFIEEEQYSQEEDGTIIFEEYHAQFIDGIYEEVQRLFNAIFTKTDISQSFEDHVKEVRDSVVQAVLM